MSFLFRPARPDDLPQIHQVFLDALNDLNARSGQPRVTTPAAEREAIRLHVMTTDPGGYWVAERGADGAILGWASSIRRGRIWFLSGFWVHPSAQNQRIGGKLLGHSLSTAPAPGEDGIISVYASRDHRALALYQRYGMYARFPLFTYGGHPGPPIDAAAQDDILRRAGLQVEQIAPAAELTPAAAAQLEVLDQVVRGPDSERGADHAFFRGSGHMTTFIFSRGGEPAGYANLASWGSIAPMAAAEEAVQEPILAYLLAEAARRRMATVSMDLPGINQVVIRSLLARRFTLLGYNFFLSSRAFGCMEQYAASGAILF